jgi:hypothetical protein
LHYALRLTLWLKGYTPFKFNAIQVYQVPRPLRQADSLEESGRWLHLHPPYATRILRRDNFLKN